MAADLTPAAVPGPVDPPDQSARSGPLAGLLASMVAPVDPARPSALDADLAPSATTGDPEAGRPVGGSSDAFHGTDAEPTGNATKANTSVEKKSIWRAWLLAGATRWGKGGGAVNKRLELAKARAQARQIKVNRTVTVNRSGGLSPKVSGAVGSGAGAKTSGGKSAGHGGAVKSPRHSNGAGHHGASGHGGRSGGGGGRGSGGHGPSGGSGFGGGRGGGNSGRNGSGDAGRAPKQPKGRGAGAGKSGSSGSGGSSGGPGGGKNRERGPAGASGKNGGQGTARTGGGKHNGASGGSKGSGGGKDSPVSLKKSGKAGASGGKQNKHSGSQSGKDRGAKGGKQTDSTSGKGGADGTAGKNGAPGKNGAAGGAGSAGTTGTRGTAPGRETTGNRQSGAGKGPRSPYQKSRETGYRDGARAARGAAHVKAYGNGLKDGWKTETEKAKRDKVRLDKAHADRKKTRDDAQKPGDPSGEDQQKKTPLDKKRPDHDTDKTSSPPKAAPDDNEPMEDPFMAKPTPIQAKGIDTTKITLGEDFLKPTVTRGELRTFKQYEARLESRIDGLSRIADATKQLAVQARDQAVDCQKLAEEAKSVHGGDKLIGELQKLADMAKDQADEADEIHKRATKAHDFAKAVLSNVQTRYAPLYQAVVDSDEVTVAELKFYRDRGVTPTLAA